MLGEWLREARQNRRRTLQAVADALNAAGRFDRPISKQTVSRLENGIGTIAVYDAVADLLNLNFVSLPDGPTLAERVKIARSRRELSHSEVSRRSGLSRNAVKGAEANDATLASFERVLAVVAPNCRPLRPRFVHKTKFADVAYTPPRLLKQLEFVLASHIDLDPCSDHPHDYVQAKKRYRIEDDGLNQDWSDPEIKSIFINPPHSDWSRWLRRSLEVYRADPSKIIVVLCPVGFQTRAPVEVILWADILLLNFRIHFWKASGPIEFGAAHSSCFIIFGAAPELLERARQVWKFVHIPRPSEKVGRRKGGKGDMLNLHPSANGMMHDAVMAGDHSELSAP